MCGLSVSSSLDLLGDGVELVQQLEVAGIIDGAFFVGDLEGDHGEDGQLGGEGLGAGYADLGSGMGIGAGVGDAGDGGADDVDDAEDKGAVLLCFFDGDDGIGGFAALGDGDDHVTGVDDGVAITEFRGIFDFDGDAAKLFEDIFGDEAGVPAGSAGDYDDARWAFVSLSMLCWIPDMVMVPLAASRRPRRQSKMVSGCSKISLSMKWS